MKKTKIEIFADGKLVGTVMQELSILDTLEDFARGLIDIKPADSTSTKRFSKERIASAFMRGCLKS